MGITDKAVFDLWKQIRDDQRKHNTAILNLLEQGSRRGGGGGGGRVGAASISIDTSLLAREATLLTRATEATLATRGSEATLLSRASEATLLLVESNTDPAGGLTIAEWLEDIEADVDGIEGRLDTLIANNTADFAANTAQIATQIALNIAQLIINAAISTANGLLTVIGNGRLGDIRTNTDAAGGLSIAEWLEDIEADVDGIEGKLDEVITELKDLTFPDSNVDVLTFSPATDAKYTARPDSSDSTAFIHHVAITNGDPIFPIAFRVFLIDGGGNKAERPDLVTTIAATQTDTIILNLDIRRACFLQIEASIASAHVIKCPHLNNGAISFDSIP